MQILKKGGKPIYTWAKIDQIEPKALEQLRNVAKLPFIFHHVAAMPDVHLGVGATIGSVIASRDAISPAAVGVDIGCGMLAVPLGKRLEQLGSLKRVREKIEEVIPVGFEGHKTAQKMTGLRPPSARIQSVWQKATYQMGTLGGGNHFIEICDDGLGQAWLMLHSGSRNVGKATAEIHIRKAKTLMKIWKIELDDPDLAYFVQKSEAFHDYMEDLGWCQEYAYQNRQRMLDLILKRFDIQIDKKSVINCHHNYVATENHYGETVFVTRKGAIRARQNDLGIIPSSMGQKSYIVRGKGNPESFCSCSHGAGRQYSRTAARRHFTVSDLIKQTEGVECRKDRGVLDEIPGAYKPIDEVMDHQKELVEIVQELKSVLCVKG